MDDDTSTSSSDSIETNTTFSDSTEANALINDVMEASTSSSFNETPWRISKEWFESLRRQKNHPKTYTLLSLAHSEIPNCIMKKYNNRVIPKEYENIHYWIEYTYFRSVGEMERCQIVSEPSLMKVKKIHISLPNDQRTLVRTCYAVKFIRKQKNKSKSEILASQIFGETNAVEICGNNQYVALMLIFPRPENVKHALVYVFGHWKQFINTYAIVPEWGLRLSLKEDICGKDLRLKTLISEFPNSYNPKMKSVQTSSLDILQSFLPNPGLEALRAIRLLPSRTEERNYGLVHGRDYFKRDIQFAKKDETCNTIRTLLISSEYHYYVSLNGRTNAEILDFFEEEIIDDEIKILLDEKLLNILKGDFKDYKKYAVSASSKIFNYLGKDVQFLINGKKTKFVYALNQVMKTRNLEVVNLESTMPMKLYEDSEINEEPIGRMIRALGIILDNKFYRYECGRWFLIPNQIFTYIRKILETRRKLYTDIGLIPYTDMHLKERDYNKDAVKIFNENTASINGKKAILIDQLFIRYSPRGNVDYFEFGDIFITNGNENYIIHVKRRSTSTTGHHCDQIIRCAEYLSNVLLKEKDSKLLLEGCIDSLYVKYKLDRMFEGSRTEIEIQRDIPVINLDSPNDWQQHFQDQLIAATENATSAFTQEMWNRRSTFLDDYPFFKNSINGKECAACINALFICDREADENLEWSDVEIFFETIKQLSRVQETLFCNGIVTDIVQKNTWIIMAIIDDQVEQFTEFKNTQCSILNDTRNFVEKSGFKFGWTIIKSTRDASAAGKGTSPKKTRRS